MKILADFKAVIVTNTEELMKNDADRRFLQRGGNANKDDCSTIYGK